MQTKNPVKQETGAFSEEKYVYKSDEYVVVKWILLLPEVAYGQEDDPTAEQRLKNADLALEPERFLVWRLVFRGT
jgi:hypothetical protein